MPKTDLNQLENFYTELLQKQAKCKISEMLLIRGWSNDEIARRTGLTVIEVDNIQKGTMPVTPEIFTKIADACHYFDFAEPANDTLN